MKILGISAGRNMGNTEILVKEALMGAEEMGASVEFIRLHDFDLKPCTGCNACVVNMFEQGGAGKCVLADDFALIDEKILDCDGLILGSPIYEKSPSGLLKILGDRMGPSHDVAFRMMAKKIRAAKGITSGTGPDERSFKKRSAALIAVGGSEWDTLALPMLHLIALTQQIDVVDKQLVNWVGLPGAVLFDEGAMERAHRSGRQVVKTLLQPDAEPEYIGEAGLCPICHSKLIEVRNDNDAYPAVCATCGVRGTLGVTDGKVTFTITDEARAKSHLLISGKMEHFKELNDVSLKPNPRMAELPQLKEKYVHYLTPYKPSR